MKPNEAIKEIMKQREHSNKSLANALGKTTASAVSNPLSRENGMRIDTFLEMVEVMDCEVIIKSTKKDKKEWKITNKSEPPKDDSTTLPKEHTSGKTKIVLKRKRLDNKKKIE